MGKKKLKMYRKRAKRNLRKHLERIYKMLNISYGEPITVILEVDRFMIFHNDRELVFNIM